MENNNILKANLLDDEPIQKKVQVKPKDPNPNKTTSTNSEYQVCSTVGNMTNNESHSSRDISIKLKQSGVKLIPILFFINKKSGSKEGEEILELVNKTVILSPIFT